MDTTTLPTVADFRRHGRFYHIENLDIYHNIPNELICYIFPHYFFQKKILNLKFIENYKNFCINLKKCAEYEDHIQEITDQKELLIRRLEDKIRDEILKKNLQNQRTSIFPDD